jgi:hypothetical protein
LFDARLGTDSNALNDGPNTGQRDQPYEIAAAREVSGLMKGIQERVEERFGVSLKPGQALVGFHLPRFIPRQNQS